MVESIPEYCLCFVRLKRRETVTTSRRDEVHGVIAVPMLESVMSIREFVTLTGTGSESGHLILG